MRTDFKPVWSQPESSDPNLRLNQIHYMDIGRDAPNSVLYYERKTHLPCQFRAEACHCVYSWDIWRQNSQRCNQCKWQVRNLSALNDPSFFEVIYALVIHKVKYPIYSLWYLNCFWIKTLNGYSMQPLVETLVKTMPHQAFGN